MKINTLLIIVFGVISVFGFVAGVLGDDIINYFADEEYINLYDYTFSLNEEKLNATITDLGLSIMNVSLVDEKGLQDNISSLNTTFNDNRLNPVNSSIQIGVSQVTNLISTEQCNGTNKVNNVSITDSGITIECASDQTGGGVTDHGDLTGLLDNDHPQYVNPTNSSIQINVGQVTDLGSTLSFLNDTNGDVTKNITTLNTTFSNFVPYEGATQNVNLSSKNLTAGGLNVSRGTLDFSVVQHTFNLSLLAGGLYVSSPVISGKIYDTLGTGLFGEYAFGSYGTFYVIDKENDGKSSITFSKNEIIYGNGGMTYYFDNDYLGFTTNLVPDPLDYAAGAYYDLGRAGVEWENLYLKEDISVGRDINITGGINMDGVYKTNWETNPDITQNISTLNGSLDTKMNVSGGNFTGSVRIPYNSSIGKGTTRLEFDEYELMIKLLGVSVGQIPLIKGKSVEGDVTGIIGEETFGVWSGLYVLHNQTNPSLNLVDFRNNFIASATISFNSTLNDGTLNITANAGDGDVSGGDIVFDSDVNATRNLEVIGGITLGGVYNTEWPASSGTSGDATKNISTLNGSLDTKMNVTGGNFTGGIGVNGNVFIANRLGIGVDSPNTSIHVVVNGEPIGVLGNSKANATGDYSMAIGYNSEASGYGSFAIGHLTRASEEGAMALGWGSKAPGFYATGIGYYSDARGEGSISLGQGSISYSEYSITIGESNGARGERGIAMGTQSNANGLFSIAMGYRDYAYGDYSNVFGYKSYVHGNDSNVIGTQSYGYGNYSTSIGYKTYTRANYSIALGKYVQVEGVNSVGIGLGLKSAESVTGNNVMGILGGNVGIGTPTPSYPLEVAANGTDNISAYFSGGISVDFIVDRTEFVDRESDALSVINTLQSKEDGSLDHESMAVELQKPCLIPIKEVKYVVYTDYETDIDEKGVFYNKAINTTVKIEEVIGYEEGTCRDLSGNINYNSKAIQELDEENNMLKTELCKKDNTYSFCK